MPDPVVTINAPSTATLLEDDSLYARVDGSRTLTGDWNAGGNQITNVGVPLTGTDAVNRDYADAIAAGLDVKQSVKAATAAALPAHTFLAGVMTASANGAFPSLDGVAVTVGQRFAWALDGVSNLEYGIYTLTDAGSAGTPWIATRATDADTSGEVSAGMCFYVEQGTVYGGKVLVLVTTAAITLNTTALQFSILFGSIVYTGGDGLTLAGTTFSVNVDGSSVEISGDALRVKALGITNAMLAGSIALTKLAESVLQADGGQAWTGDQDAGGKKLTNLGTPLVSTDATTKAYVDALVGGDGYSNYYEESGPPDFSAPQYHRVIDRDGIEWIQLSPVTGYAWERWLGKFASLRWKFSSETIPVENIDTSVTLPVTAPDDKRWFTAVRIEQPCYLHALGIPIKTAAGDAAHTFDVKAALYTALRTDGDVILPQALVANAIFAATNKGGTSTALQIVPFSTLSNCPVFLEAGYYFVAANFSPDAGTQPTPQGRAMLDALSPLKRDRQMASTYSSEAFTGTLTSGSTTDAGTTTPGAINWGLLLEY